MFIKNDQDIKAIVPSAIRSTNNELLTSYGFISKPYEPKWHNIEAVLGNMSPGQYFNRPSQMAYHNLCENTQPPDGIGTTLGLGLKFCVQEDRPPDVLGNSFKRFQTDVRKKFTFAGTPPKTETPAKIYVKSNWIPDPALEHVEKRISTFCKTIHAELKFLRKIQKKSSNLTALQKSHLNFLRSNRNFVILNADKNLGPVIMERDMYLP